MFTALDAIGFGGGLRHLDAGEAHALEPALSGHVGAALHATVDRHVEPSTLAKGLADHLVAHGASVRSGAAVERLVRSGERWRVVMSLGDEAVDAVVVAASLDSHDLVRPFGLRPPLLPAKGYSVTVRHAEPTPALPLYLCEPKIGLSPFHDGLRIAGFFEIGARDDAPSAPRCRQLVEEARRYVTGLADELAPAGAPWAGFRPATPDSLPLLGRVPGAPGLVLATGHGMLGVTLAAPTGAAVAGLLRGEDDGWLAPFSPARFG